MILNAYISLYVLIVSRFKSKDTSGHRRSCNWVKRHKKNNSNANNRL